MASITILEPDSDPKSLGKDLRPESLSNLANEYELLQSRRWTRSVRQGAHFPRLDGDGYVRFPDRQRRPA